MTRLTHFMLFTLISGCTESNHSKIVVRDTLHRLNYIIEHISGPALSRSKDKIYVESGDTQDLIFEGYGGDAIMIKPLREGVVIVRYCGGSIRRVSSFRANRGSSEIAVAVVVQPIITADVAVRGIPICAALQ